MWFQEPVTGTKRKAEGPPGEARATLASLAKRRRAEVDAFMHCTLAVATGAPTAPVATPPTKGAHTNGATTVATVKGEPRSGAAAAAAAAAHAAATESILLAGRFFDEVGAGFIEAQDLEDIFHNCYPYSSRRWVRSLVEEMTRYGKVKYKEFSHLWVQYYPALVAPTGASAPC